MSLLFEWRQAILASDELPGLTPEHLGEGREFGSGLRVVGVLHENGGNDKVVRGTGLHTPVARLIYVDPVQDERANRSHPNRPDGGCCL
jgi:hypothetical protein